MPSPRRSTRHNQPPPIDASPELDPDDLRRTGSAGMWLLSLSCAITTGALGLLILPSLTERSPVEVAPETKPSPSPVPVPAASSKVQKQEFDSHALYPHENALPASATRETRPVTK